MSWERRLGMPNVHNVLTHLTVVNNRCRSTDFALLCLSFEKL